MFEKCNKARDAFAFSLGGITAKMSFVTVPAIADDRINRIRDAHQGELRARRAEAAREVAQLPEDALCTQSA